MSWFDVAKDIGTDFLGEEEKKVVGIADLVGDSAAAGYDALTGDTEHAKEHAVEMMWDTAGVIAPPGVDMLVDGAHTAKDFKETVEADPNAPPDHDEGGTGAKWGAIAGLALGPLGALEGAALGGYLGDKMKPTMQGAGVPKDAGAEAAAAAQLAFGHYAE